jgi:hypothetical protein
MDTSRRQKKDTVESAAYYKFYLGEDEIFENNGVPDIVPTESLEKGTTS